MKKILNVLANNRVSSYLHKDIVPQKYLGKGTLGEVYKGKIHVRRFAFKVVNTLKIQNVFEDISAFTKEIFNELLVMSQF